MIVKRFERNRSVTTGGRGRGVRIANARMWKGQWLQELGDDHFVRKPECSRCRKAGVDAGGHWAFCAQSTEASELTAKRRISRESACTGLCIHNRQKRLCSKCREENSAKLLSAARTKAERCVRKMNDSVFEWGKESALYAQPAHGRVRRMWSVHIDSQ